MASSRWPSALLARAVRCRTAGDLPGEERLLRQCVALGDGGGRLRRRAAEREAIRTAHFYLALTGCQLGRFAEADGHLARLGLAARLSDSIWAERPAVPLPADFFVRVVDDGLPPDLVEHARRSLHPDSIYWSAHHYDDADVAFYSHAHHPGQRLHVVDQLIGALQPLLEAIAPDVARSVTMAEWWVHQRRHDQWHGHPLHFDTDEQLLRSSQGRALRHPAVSTVVYLSDDSPRFGPTLVTSQRAAARGREQGRRGEESAEVAAAVRPRPGRVLFFDGGYLHGALPGRPWLAAPGGSERRLCLMVGWWTEPIAPLPPAEVPRPLTSVDTSAAWVKALAPCPSPPGQPLRRPPSEGGRGRPVDVGALSPIWADVPGVTERGTPFFGRFFLTHRGQVDDDIFN